ncbi:MAG: polysaccharide deacetylase family protein [Oscillospiraceae bacterium]|nr:polysaccharide deacetylase family protein [Oscillospiraceae bacterium]
MKIWVFSKRAVLSFICLVLCAAIAVFGFAAKATSASAAAKKLPIYAVETDEKKVAVTFDAAWTNQDTDELIEILKRHNAKATVFIVGDWAEKFPESVKAFYDNGHTVANHSDTHKAFSKCSYKEIREEILNCNEKLEGIIDDKVTLVRAPSGDYTDQSLSVAAELKMTMIQWDVDSLDYRGLSVEEITDRVVSRTVNGSIILFHNGVENTAAALESVLTALGEKGYSFVTVDELIYNDNYYLDFTGRQHRSDS